LFFIAGSFTASAAHTAVYIDQDTHAIWIMVKITPGSLGFFILEYRCGGGPSKAPLNKTSTVYCIIFHLCSPEYVVVVAKNNLVNIIA
jgi:hypothetical protein